MKVTIVSGSPRKNGSCARLIKEVLPVFEKAKVKVTHHRLNDLTFKDCQACMACKSKSEICVLNDDLTQVLADVAQSEAFILASPIYIGEVTGQTRCFIDRTFSYLLPDFHTNPKPSRLKAPKKAAFFFTQGNPDRKVHDLSAAYKGFLNVLGFSEVEILRACNVSGEEDVEAQKDLLIQAQQIAEKLIAK